MDDKLGGLSSAERQRQTAAAIARKKVLAAYAAHTTKTDTTPVNSYKKAPIKATVRSVELQKYHSAWQQYYQKYYGEYYARAAHNYIAVQQLKAKRAKADEQKLLEDSGLLTETPHAKPPDITTPEQTKNNSDPLTTQTLKTRLRAKIRREASDHYKKTRRHRHLVPILAGLAVVLFFLFLQYNRLVFAPIIAYISPGNAEASSITPADPNSTTAASADPKLIIPKLSIDVPVHFNISNDTKTVMGAMNHGVAHFAIPGANALPGQVGNLVITGHSAGDIYSNNQYKFIFSGLERLANNDLIYVDYQSVRYTYSVTGQQVVEPDELSALTRGTDKPILTLITCTPLGTSRYRLLVSATQISPGHYSKNPAPSSANTPTNANSMPSNTPSFFEGIWHFLTGQT